MPLLETRDEISEILPAIRTAAILGIKAEPRTAPAYYVPEYAQEAGIRIIPVPVFFPDVTEILGESVYRTLAEVPKPVDAVVIFRRPNDIPAHVADILACHPSVVWMQSGIRHPSVAEQLSAAGINVVQNRCLMVELQSRGM